MNTKPTFQEQYNKIVTAYMQNELQPMYSCACFIGNLLNNNSSWGYIRIFNNNCTIPIKEEGNFEDIGIQTISKESSNLYTLEDILELEGLFLSTLGATFDEVRKNQRNEEILFKAMEVTLGALKAIHEKKGEIVPSYDFTKRELVAC